MMPKRAKFVQSEKSYSIQKAVSLNKSPETKSAPKKYFWEYLFCALFLFFRFKIGVYSEFFVPFLLFLALYKPNVGNAKKQHKRSKKLCCT